MILLLVAVACFTTGVLLGRYRRTRDRRLYVEVGDAFDCDDRKVRHTISARIRRGRNGYVIHHEWVDMRTEGWEETLATATAQMKQKRRELEAAQRIARER